MEMLLDAGDPEMVNLGLVMLTSDSIMERVTDEEVTGLLKKVYIKHFNQLTRANPALAGILEVHSVWNEKSRRLLLTEIMF